MKNLNIKFLHDCLLIKNILIIGDIHIGYDEQFHGKAIFPGMQIKEIIEKLKEVFNFLEKKKIKVRKIIQLGDFKHDFETITDVEWRETLQLLDYFIEKVGKENIIIIKGNHDNILKPILEKRNIKLKNYYCVRIKEGKKVKKICFLHGNKLFKQCLDSDCLVFGHLHPAITLYDKYKSEKYKCFLKGKWKIGGKNKEVYILPSFSSVSFGYELNDIDLINMGVRNGYENKNKNKDKSKFFVIPNKDLKNLKVIIYNNEEKKEYNFGMLKELINKINK